MGWFIPLLALAATAAGAGLQAAGASNARREANQKTLNELARQRGFQRETSQEFARSLERSGVDDAQQGIQQGQQEREGLYNQLQSMPLSQGGHSVLTQTDPATTLRDVAQMRAMNQSRARLGGYETWLLDQAVRNLRSQQQIGILGSLSNSSGNVLPLELNDAAQSGQGLYGAGSFLGALGNTAGLYGIGG